MENTIKYEDWINTKTFEVKSLPVGYGLWSSEWVKIPDDAEFAVGDGNDLEFRKGISCWSNISNTWVTGSLVETGYPVDVKIVWQRKTTKGVIKGALAEGLGKIWKDNMTMPKTGQQMQGDTYTQFIEDRTEVFKKLLQGVKFQYRYNDAGQWHNLTDKSMGHFLKPNVVVREKPQKPVIDSIEMDKEAAIKYIQKHY